jgi:phosphoribosylamine--glycine ligase
LDKKNFLFVSLDALSVDLAWQIVKEGHGVKYYTDSASERDIGDGFVPKTDHWEKEIDWADVIIFDDVLGQGAKAQELRAAGKAVIGGSAYSDRLEDDRSFGQEELRDAGIPIIPYKEFSDFDSAVTFVTENPGRYALKPSGEAQNVKRFLFVGEEDDGVDVIQVLEAYKRVWSDRIKVFQLQKRMIGVEVAVGAFFNGKEFITPINVNFEHKKLFPGNLGPATGEMGTTMYWSEPNRLFNSTLKKFEHKLAQEGYRGYFDVNCIVNANGIYPLEFTARFGYPTISIQQEGIITPMSEVLYNLANSINFKLRTRKGFQVGVRIILPPYPFDDDATFDSLSKEALILFKRPSYEGIHIEDAKLVNGQWVVAGTSGVVLTVCGTGSTLRQAQAQAYSRVKNIMIPNMYYRNDIGERWFEDSDRLHNWGYLREG